jgi:hypothetical protein
VGRGIAVDTANNAYVTGYGESTNFPTTSGAFLPTNPNAFNPRAFVTKLNATGTALDYSTYLRGGATGADAGETDQAFGVAVDALGNAYVTGATSSASFPTTAEAYQPTRKGVNYDVFVTKVLPSGAALVYSTYLGGTGVEFAQGIAVDATGDAT